MPRRKKENFLTFSKRKVLFEIEIFQWLILMLRTRTQHSREFECFVRSIAGLSMNECHKKYMCGSRTTHMWKVWGRLPEDADIYEMGIKTIDFSFSFAFFLFSNVDPFLIVDEIGMRDEKFLFRVRNDC